MVFIAKTITKREIMVEQICKTCARCDKKQMLCKYRNEKKNANDTCYHWLMEDEETQNKLGIPKDVWNIVEKAVGKNNTMGFFLKNK